MASNAVIPVLICQVYRIAYYKSFGTFFVCDFIATDGPLMSGVHPLFQHVVACGNRVCGGLGPMKWTQSMPGSHLASEEQFRQFSGFEEGAKGSFQDVNVGKHGDQKLSCIKDIFTNPDWIKWVTGFHKTPG